MTLCVTEYPVDQFGLAVLVAFLSSFLPASGLLMEPRDWEKEKALMLCKYCSGTVTTAVGDQHSSGHISNTQHHRGCSAESNSVAARGSVLTMDKKICGEPGRC